MAKGFLYGNGGGGVKLNFRIICGTSTPANPKENDIWVNSDQRMTGYYFAPKARNPHKIELTCVSELTRQCFDAEGRTYTNTNFNISNYVELPATTETITLYHGTSSNTGMYHVFYDANKNFISTVERENGTVAYDVPSNAAYVRFSLYSVGTADSMTFLATVDDSQLEGMVWISTGTSGPIQFDALKKNGIQVCPISAKQYVNGAWVDVPAMSYQNGTWVEWVTVLYNSGNQCASITGGYGTLAPSGGFWTYSDVKFDTDRITFNGATSGNYVSYAVTKNKIDLTEYKKITLKVVGFAATGAYACGRLGATATNTSWESLHDNATALATFEGGTTGDVVLDVSSLTGEYYVAFGLDSQSSGGKLEVTGVWMQ